jgi:hypothetical protein
MAGHAETVAVEPGRENPRIVEDQTVAGFEELGKVAEGEVFPALRFAVH